MLVTIRTADGVVRKVVNESSFTIGRSIESAIAFTETNVSRNHLLVKIKRGKIWISDQNSANGTFKNGERLTPDHLTPIGPGDIIRLGKSSDEITIQAIERAFSEAVLDESSISVDDRASISRLVHGAHAEASRLVEVGNGIHENLLKAAEERAKGIEHNMMLNREKILRQAELEAAELIEEGKAERHRLLAGVQKEAEAIHSKVLAKAKTEAAQLISEAEKIVELRVQEATASRLEAEALFSDSIAKAKAAAEQLLIETEKLGEQRAEESAARLRAETSHEMDEQLQKTESLKQVLSGQQRENEALKASVETLTQQIESLRAEDTQLSQELVEAKTQSLSLAREVRDLEDRKKHLVHTVEDLAKRTSEADRELESSLLTKKDAVENELQRQTKALEEEINQLRIVRLEQFKAERSAAIAEIIRDRERLAKKILLAMETSIVKHMPVEAWRKIALETEHQITAQLTKGSLTADSSANLTPMIAEATRLRKRAHRNWLVQGLLAGMALVFVFDKFSESVTGDHDPMKTAAEDSARLQREDLERRRFDPPQDAELRETYAASVIYTKDFVANYLNQDFQKQWLKKASSYFLKVWHVQEESVVEAIATINTLVKTLEERKQAIHPDYVKDGLKKMDDLETETMARVQELLGSEVRVQAFRSLEKSSFTKFISVREPASVPSDPESAD